MPNSAQAEPIQRTRKVIPVSKHALQASDKLATFEAEQEVLRMASQMAPGYQQRDDFISAGMYKHDQSTDEYKD